MKITDQIKDYDKLTPEEKIKALEEIEDQSEEIERYKNAVSKANGEAADFKKQLRAKQSDEEAKAEADKEARQKLLDELETLKKKDIISTYKASFLGLGLNEDESLSASQNLADGKIQDVFKSLKRFLEVHDKETESKLMKNTPVPKVGDQTPVTKKFSDMSYAERAQLFTENPEKYAELKKG